jgi:hypothetical protein
VPLERRELTGAFSRLVPGEVISAGSSQFVSSPSSAANSTFGQEPEALDILPPSRVTDLRVHVEPTTQRVTFQWTAVGDDFDIGTGKNISPEMISLEILLQFLFISCSSLHVRTSIGIKQNLAQSAIDVPASRSSARPDSASQW